MTHFPTRASRSRFAHAVVCTAGGWTGGGVGDAGLAASTDAMLRVCLQPAIDAARLAGDFLEPQGTVVLTGAAAALGPTPGMLGYGMAKAATHHLVRSLAAAPEPGVRRERGREGLSSSSYMPPRPACSRAVRAFPPPRSCWASSPACSTRRLTGRRWGVPERTSLGGRLLPRSRRSLSFGARSTHAAGAWR